MKRTHAALALSVALLCGCPSKTEPVASSPGDIDVSKAVALYEGMPHPLFEHALLQQEKANHSPREWYGHPFYRERLQVEANDARRLLAILADKSTFKPFSGEKKCGGFHPDYMIERVVEGRRSMTLICFHCREAKIRGSVDTGRYDLSREAFQRLRELLEKHRKNRPAGGGVIAE